MPDICRRSFVAGGISVGIVTGCSGQLEPVVPVVSPTPGTLRPVDIHAHIFNARDIPIDGFISKVFLSNNENASLADDFLGAFAALIIDIVLAVNGTKTARQEYNEITKGASWAPLSEKDALEVDQQKIEEGIRIFALRDAPEKSERRFQLDTDAMPEAISFEADILIPIPQDVQPLAAQLRLSSVSRELKKRVSVMGPQMDVSTRPSYSELGKQTLLDQLDRETLVLSPMRAAPISLSAETSEVEKAGRVREAEIATQARQVTRGIFGAFPEATPKLVRRPGKSQFSVGQHLRWAALLARDRRDILAEHTRLYGGFIKIVSPSIVDFDHWLLRRRDTDPQGQNIVDQMDVMSAIARTATDRLVLNFAPFCPLRAFRMGGDRWLRVVQDAVETKGFAGIKLYPPMGFRPIGNAGNQLDTPDGVVDGADIDRELIKLYQWCAQEDVPIKSHGNNSLAAYECSGLFASPQFWGRVLARPGLAKLRVNIAHFGGFHEELNPDDCAKEQQQRSFERYASDLITPQNNLYVDLGYWMEGMISRDQRDLVGPKIKELLAENAELSRRIMLGTDFSMIGREALHGAYLSEIVAYLPGLGLDPELVQSSNALHYLGLSGRVAHKQVNRLETFFDRAIN